MAPSSKTILWPATVFYDGSCGVCHRFADRLREKDNGKRFHLVDISSETFRPEAFGLDPRRVMERLHVKSADGRIFTGIEAIRLTWTAFPILRVAAFLTGLPGIHFCADRIYGTFARSRHRGASCYSGRGGR